jgi:hypothetical protein
MTIRHDTEDALEKYEITKIDGQPTEEDLNLLVKELSNAVGSIATTNGGGEHGHVGIIVEETEYITFSNGGAKFVVPTNPGAYPATVDPDAVIREQQIAEHKAKIVEYETFLGVQNFCRRQIVKSVDHEWIAELESETMGFNHKTPKELIAHLRDVGGTLDHMDVTELTANLQKDWDGIEAPAAHFARGDRYERQLEKAGQSKNPTLRLAFGLATFQKSGEFEASLRTWEEKSARQKTFANFRVFIQKEFAKHYKQNKSTAKSVGHGIANNVTDEQANQIDTLEAQAMIMAEVANSIAEQNQKQFKEMMSMFQKALETKNSPNAPNAPTNSSGGKQKKKCPHCAKLVYHKPEKCFELEANAANRPAGWKSAKES